MTHHKYSCAGCGAKITKKEWDTTKCCKLCKDDAVVIKYECVNCGKKHFRDWHLDKWMHGLCRKCYEKDYFEKEKRFYKNILG